jgi:hypothetical protein
MKLDKYLMLIAGVALSTWFGYSPMLKAQEGPVEITRLTLTPTKSPLPAMKYELLPKAIDRVPGNAAVHYGKVKSEQNIFFSSKEVSNKIQLAQEQPLSELKTNADLDFLTNMGAIYASLKRGARCESVDWQLPIRDEFIGNLLLPEVQESRSFGRILQARARVQMARGDIDGAIESIQTGLALARHVAQGETLINGLVGVAISNMMLQAAQELITQPETPNLYWALSTLPSPLIDLRPGLEAEQQALYWTERKWLHPELLTGDDDFWRSELERLWRYVSGFLEKPNGNASLSARVVRGYPSAKKRLIERGFKADEVESMPVTKVVMLDSLHQYNCNRDAQFAAVQQALLDPSRISLLAKVEVQEHEESLSISRAMGVGTYVAIINSSLRSRRSVAILQTIEAIRMFAATTGKLPVRLNDITAVIVPNDPSTNQPFSYELKQDVAVLSSLTLGIPIRLELKLK